MFFKNTLAAIQALPNSEESIYDGPNYLLCE